LEGGVGVGTELGADEVALACLLSAGLPPLDE